MKNSRSRACSFFQSRYDARMALKSLLIVAFVLFSPAFAVQAAADLTKIEALIAAGNDQAAINRLKRVVKSDPKDYQAWFLLGVTQARKSHFDEAIVAFRQVSKLQPDLAEPHNNLAVIYNEMGNLRAAVKELEASLKLNPGYVTAHENIGDLYVKLAASAYKQALSKQENAALRARYENLLRIRSTKAEKPVTTEKIASGEKAKPSVTAAQPEARGERADSRQQALDAIEAWRRAWSERDLGRYFAAYAADFDPGKRFKSQDEWRAYKQSVISKRSFINVTINNIVISEMADGRIKAVFLQGFRSDSYQSDDRKELILKNSDGGWKIVHELSS